MYVYDANIEYILFNSMNDLQIEFDRIVKLMKNSEENFTKSLEN